MTRRNDLEQSIRESGAIIHELEEQKGLSSDVIEKRRCDQQIKQQFALLRGYVEEYLLLCMRLGVAVPEDIQEWAIRVTEPQAGQESESRQTPGRSSGQSGVQQIRIALLDILRKRFTPDELQVFCFQLEVPWHELAGTTHPGRVISLLEYMEQRERLPDVVTVGKSTRPDIDWPDL